MNQLSIIIEAIESRKQICFEYNAPNKVVGKRYGNPHCLFMHPTTNNLVVDIIQIGGVSDSGSRLPSWRQLKLIYMVNIIIVDDCVSFELGEGYNPNSNNYSKVISKV